MTICASTIVATLTLCLFCFPQKYGLSRFVEQDRCSQIAFGQKREVFVCWEKISAKSLREKGLLKLEDDELCGIYKWWAAKEELLKILKKLKVVDFIDVDKEIEHKEIENKEMYCIYVGKATDLRDRLKKHMRGSIDNSTLRKSLGAILWNGEKKEDLKNKTNDEFIDKFFVEYKCVENAGLLDVEESEEISKCLRILNIDGFNHKTFMQYINQPLSDLRDELKNLK